MAGLADKNEPSPGGTSGAHELPGLVREDAGGNLRTPRKSVKERQSGGALTWSRTGWVTWTIDLIQTVGLGLSTVRNANRPRRDRNFDLAQRRRLHPAAKAAAELDEPPVAARALHLEQPPRFEIELLVPAGRLAQGHGIEDDAGVAREAASPHSRRRHHDHDREPAEGDDERAPERRLRPSVPYLPRPRRRSEEPQGAREQEQLPPGDERAQSLGMAGQGGFFV